MTNSSSSGRPQARPPGGRRTLSLARHLTYANVTSTLALFLAAAGGTALATSGDAPTAHASRRAAKITGSQIATHTITSRNVKPHSLLASDLAPGALSSGPAGPQGPQGPPGPPGATGATGTAAAYAEVVNTGVGQASYAVNQGFPGHVSNPHDGVFCLTAPSGVDPNTPLALGVVGANLSGQANANNALKFAQQTAPSDCGSGQFEILTYAETAGPGGVPALAQTNAYFTVLAP